MKCDVLKMFLLLGGFLGGTMLGCRPANNPTPVVVAPAPARAVHTFSVVGTKRTMSLQPEQSVFPQQEGYSEFASYCSMCHSLLHISMQPDFPREIWENEVHKMVEKYNAPIDSATATKIIDYLVAIKGEK